MDTLAAAESEASPCFELADAVGLQPPEPLYSGGGATIIFNNLWLNEIL